MIELQKVTREYPGLKAVDDLSFTVSKGEFCVLIGPSGCGKSTTLRMINRLVLPTSGSILIEGVDIRKSRPEELRRGIGYVIQSVGLFPHMTVNANITVVPRLLKWSAARMDQRADELLELFGLDPAEYRDKYPRQLSGGEAQRVGVARALAADPPILLMDEPFGAIDPITRETLQIEFARIQKDLKKTIIFVTHDIDEAIRLAGRIVILKEGRLVQYDTPENIMTRPADRFVTEFIGTDRALKRLSRIPVKQHIRAASSVRADTPLSDLPNKGAGERFMWVTDGRGILLGWVETGGVTCGEGTASAIMTRLKHSSAAVMGDSTLKEALSRMVQQGIRSAPVVDSKGLLEGEIRLEDILEA
ncbi:MAG: ABC transporter ATP-binding protein [bacterium]|nr:ABC transporter ATP-binding protein [bacterium]MDT8396300.1 ABC transporter ATP-binding protein [bacterium]